MPAVFLPNFTATVRVSSLGTSLEISQLEGVARASRGTLSGNTGQYSGNGTVSAQPANWTVTVVFETSAIATIEETITLPDRNCSAQFTASALRVQ